jgi:hypothetical protein
MARQIHRQWYYPASNDDKAETRIILAPPNMPTGRRVSTLEGMESSGPGLRAILD